MRSFIFVPTLNPFQMFTAYVSIKSMFEFEDRPADTIESYIDDKETNESFCTGLPLSVMSVNAAD
jgi:hypothetical protein